MNKRLLETLIYEQQFSDLVKFRKVHELKIPEYSDKKDLIGDKRKLLKSIERNGVAKPILINTYPGRENMIFNGVEVYRICKQKEFDELPVLEYYLTPEEEKELHYTFNLKISATPEEVVKHLLGKNYDTFFDDIIEVPKADKKVFADAAMQPKIKMNDRAKQLAVYLNNDELAMLDKVKKNEGCETPTAALRTLLTFYLTTKGLI